MVERAVDGDISCLDFTVGSSRFRIAPESGFRLMRWSITAAMGRREILYWPEQTGHTPMGNVRGGNPILFPFASRSYDRGVAHAWRAPGCGRLPMPFHGFARDSLFRVAFQSDNTITGELVPDETARQAYPFDYAFSVTYRFEELALKVDLNLENRGPAAIPWSAGHHFYFTLPWHQGARRQDYQLNLEARKCAYVGPDGKLVPQKDRETCHDFSDTALQNRIHWQLRHNRIFFGPKGGEEDIHLIIGPDPVPAREVTVVTWAESPEAPYYCVEPWMGLPNAAEHGKGLHWVGPGESGSFTVEVSLF